MNTSLVVLLIMGIFLASARPEDCNQQSTKEAVCELQTLVKQQSKPSIGETDLAPMMNVISSLRDAGTAGRKAIKADLDKLRKDVAMKADLVESRKDVVAMKADLDKLRKDVAMRADLVELKKDMTIKLADLDKLRKEVAMKADLDKLRKDIAIIKEVMEATKDLVTPKYKSCQELYDDGKGKNKAYELTLEGGKTQVYCHMDAIAGCGSGGFTLAMKIDGTKNTFLYDSAWWSNKALYNAAGGATGFDNQETKLPTYWMTPFTKVCLGMKVGNQTKFISISIRAHSLYSLIADGQYRATSLSREAWKSLISGSSLQPKCNKEGFNAVGSRSDMSKARIGITSNQENNCDSNDSRIGFGTGGHPDNTISCGDVARHDGDKGDKNIAAFGYILVQ